ncbi:hypothetical protein [Roseococcus sp. YIM B11640]|uniref:hypothetical protein n=1 Tax=Roseococcus sp. YIM B11640 TaxID=3133973 RepID=UPI003C7DBD3D
MRRLLTILTEGAMVVVPLGAVALLVIAIVRRLAAAADTVAPGYVHPLVAAVLLGVVLLLVVGLLVSSAPGRRMRRFLEGSIFDRIPGYRLAKVVTGEGLLATGKGKGMRPALASIEEGWCPAIVTEEFADGRLVVFVPGSPAPMSGTLYIFTPERVRFLDVPILPFMQSVAAWGLGLRELLEKAEQARPAEPPPLPPPAPIRS